MFYREKAYAEAEQCIDHLWDADWLARTRLLIRLTRRFRALRADDPRVGHVTDILTRITELLENPCPKSSSPPASSSQLSSSSPPSTIGG